MTPEPTEANHKLTVVSLSEATPEQLQQFAKMLSDECDVEAMQESGHLCWFFIPSLAEYERMKKFAQPPDYDRCPKCGKGRVVVEIFRGNFGDSWHLVCRWGKEGCDFKEYISDDE